MADLVTEVAEHGPIGLVEFGPAPFEFGGVGFGERNRHQAVLVAGHDLLPVRVRRIGQKVEGEPVDRVFGAGLERQPPAQQAVEQPMLREFDLPPGRDMRGVREVRE